MFGDAPAADALAEDAPAAAAAVGSMAADVAEAAAEALEKILPASADEDTRAWTLAAPAPAGEGDGCCWNATFLAAAFCSFLDDVCL